VLDGVDLNQYLVDNRPSKLLAVPYTVVGTTTIISNNYYGKSLTNLKIIARFILIGKTATYYSSWPILVDKLFQDVWNNLTQTLWKLQDRCCVN
jgi:hypothetical protein